MGSEFERFMKMKDVKALNQEIGKLDMGNAYSFYVPKEHTVDERVLMSKGPALGVAQLSGAPPRKRSAFAVEGLFRMYPELPEEHAFGGKRAVGEAMESKIFATCDTRGTLGRLLKDYPATTRERSRRPVTAEEAQVSVRSCGLDISGQSVEPKEFLGIDPADAIKINTKSSNGFPVLGSAFEGEAKALVVPLYLSYRQKFESYQKDLEGMEKIEEYIRTAEEDPRTLPYFACLGKCKGDMYSVEKYMKAQMRFYNVVPRHLMLYMQEATQAVEDVALNILDTWSGSCYSQINRDRCGGFCHSFGGVALTSNGAERLVEALQEQLSTEGLAFVHMGDDSWVILLLTVAGQKYVLMFALDCTSFDLTQEAAVTEQVHRALRSVLAHVQTGSAAVWHAYMRQRVVVLAGALTKRFFHGGPSGMPMQSKVNDTLMDVLIRRVVKKINVEELLSEGSLDALLQEQGKSMGFKVRLEQYSCVPLPEEFEEESVMWALMHNPFLFVGFYFYVQGERVQVFCDLPRSLAQLAYPTQRWIGDKDHLKTYEAVRLGSVALSQGVPPEELRPAYEKLREYALGLLSEAKATNFATERATMEAPWVELDTSLNGLHAALSLGPESVWLHQKSKYATLYPKVSLVGRPVKLVAPREHTATSYDAHMPTRFNAGRPPPDTFWGAEKQPRAAEELHEKEVRPVANRDKRMGVEPQEEEEDDSVWRWGHSSEEDERELVESDLYELD
jgi:hypothetical protein